MYPSAKSSAEKVIHLPHSGSVFKSQSPPPCMSDMSMPSEMIMLQSAPLYPSLHVHLPINPKNLKVYVQYNKKRL